MSSEKDSKKKKMMLQGIVEIGEIAYKEELDRKKSLIEQSNGLVVVITLLITFLGLLLDIIISNFESVDLEFIFIMFSVIIFVFKFSLCFKRTLEKKI